jgi:hypothetical protein
MKGLSFFRNRRFTGFSVAESVVAMGIGGIAIAGGMALNSQQLQLTKSVRETNAASHALEERIEQLRLVNWKQLTDPAYVAAHYFPKTPQSAHVLPGFYERVTVTAFPDETACTPLAIERDASGQMKVLLNGRGLNEQRLARVNVRITWQGKDSKERIRELASIISNAGINSTSLPVLGAESGATEETPTPTTPTEETPTTPTTPTETTPTPTPGNNGNGNGQGNVGGKPGKK